VVDFDTPHAVAGIGLARICARVTEDSVAHEPVLGVADEIRAPQPTNHGIERALKACSPGAWLDTVVGPMSNMSPLPLMGLMLPPPVVTEDGNRLHPDLRLRLILPRLRLQRLTPPRFGPSADVGDRKERRLTPPLTHPRLRRDDRQHHHRQEGHDGYGYHRDVAQSGDREGRHVRSDEAERASARGAAARANPRTAQRAFVERERDQGQLRKER
jgi:hypothetical protein